MPEEYPTQLEIRSATGDLLLTIALAKNGTQRKPEPRPAVPRREPERSVPQQAPRQAVVHKAQGGNGSGTGRDPAEPMTEAQKRFMFRILAEGGIERDQAHEKLKTFFQVRSLKDVSKQEASQGIERLLEEAKGGGQRP